MSVDTLQELITWPLSEISDETSEPVLNLNEKRKSWKVLEMKGTFKYSLTWKRGLTLFLQDLSLICTMYDYITTISNDNFFAFSIFT